MVWFLYHSDNKLERKIESKLLVTFLSILFILETFAVFLLGGRHTKSVPISIIKQISENKGHYLVIISLFYWYIVLFGALLGENVAL